MSSSSECSLFSGHRPAKSPAEKSKFSQTCSLLSQYLKDKGSFRDLTLGLGITLTVETKESPEASCHSATTMESFPTSKNMTAMDFLSPQDVYPSHSELPSIVKSSCVVWSMEKEPKAAQLTIFYDGQVVVFDDFPADKVEEIISLASKGVPQRQNSSAYAHTHNQQGNNHLSNVPNTIPQAPSTPIVCEMPIARKNSLHRFLAKRKDRIVAKAPYQTKNPKSAPNKPAESISNQQSQH